MKNSIKALAVMGAGVALFAGTSQSQAEASTLQLHLPASASTWTVYKMGHPLVKSNAANIAGVLAPSKFGGLTYNIVGTVGPNSYLINTQSFGEVEIYAGPETGATVSGSTTTSTVINTTIAAAPSKGQAIVNYAKKYLGMPYVWGGSSPSTSFDCSGFIYWVFKNNGYNIPRTSVSGYWNMTSRIQHVSTPQIGDLVFFQGTYGPGPTHIGIYVGNGQMIDAQDRGIVIDNISNSYWSSHFLGYGRILY